MRHFEPDVRELGERVIEVSRNYSVWWALVNTESRTKYHSVFCDHADFLDSTAHAHFLSLTVISHQLLDSREDVLSVTEFLDRIEGHHGALVAHLRDRLRPHWDIYERLSLVRSKVYAHREYSASPETVFRVAGLTSEAIGASVDVLRDVLDALFREFVPLHSKFEFYEEASRRSHYARTDIEYLLEALSNNTLERSRDP